MKKKRIGGALAAAGAAAVLSGLCTGRAFCLDMESYAGLLDKERMSGETEYMVSGDQDPGGRDLSLGRKGGTDLPPLRAEKDPVPGRLGAPGCGPGQAL